MDQQIIPRLSLVTQLKDTTDKQTDPEHVFPVLVDL